MERADAGPDRLEELTREMARMRSITSRHAVGELGPAQLPTDMHTYCGRIQDGERELVGLNGTHLREAQMPEEEYDRHVGDARPRGAYDPTIHEYLEERRGEIESGWRAVPASSAAEAGAATNYFRGRADEWNSNREALIRADPQRANDLPPAIQVDETRVRQQVIDQERSEEKSLAVAR